MEKSFNISKDNSIEISNLEALLDKKIEENV